MSTQLIKNRKLVTNHWQLPDEVVDSNNHTFQALADFIQAPYESSGGVLLEPDDDPIQLAPHIASVAVIALRFPSFHEGRGYSQARVLREKLGFVGEIRALGAYRDNLLLMEQCGINAFELAEQENDIASALAAFVEAYPVHNGVETKHL